MRRELTRATLVELMREIARCSPGKASYRVFLIGGGTAVLQGWRASTIDADLHADRDEVFRDIQDIKERLQLNVEFVRPENFVPALEGSENRHVFIARYDRVSFFHYDPYAQVLSKVVRGFARDLLDAELFVTSEMVDPQRLLALVRGIAKTAYARYPALSRQTVHDAVDDFVSGLEQGGKAR